MFSEQLSEVRRERQWECLFQTVRSVTSRDRLDYDEDDKPKDQGSLGLPLETPLDLCKRTIRSYQDRFIVRVFICTVKIYNYNNYLYS